MSSKEGRLMAEIMIDASKKGWRLFRNSVGLAWQGKPNGEIVTRTGISIILAGARRVRFGLAVGSGDLIGWRPVVITDDMVGTTIAQFASVEVKTSGYARATKEQKNWMDQVNNAGGYGIILREGDIL